MCGRYTLTLTKNGIRAEIPTIGSFGMPWQPRYNIAPSEIIPAITSDAPDALNGLRWGLIPSWAKDPSIGFKMINARRETMAEKPAYRNAYRKRRCLIPADGFYEWQKRGKKKIPIYFRLKRKTLFTFAGLWESWSSPDGKHIRSCTIITTEANQLVKTFHDRMPVIVAPEQRAAWLDVTGARPAELNNLTAPYDADAMEAYEVSTSVNRPDVDSEVCIERVG